MPTLEKEGVQNRPGSDESWPELLKIRNWFPKEIKRSHMAALTSSLRARQRGLEMTPEDRMVQSALKVCKEVQTDSERFLKASSEEEEVMVVKLQR